MIAICNFACVSFVVDYDSGTSVHTAVVTVSESGGTGVEAAKAAHDQVTPRRHLLLSFSTITLCKEPKRVKNILCSNFH